MLAMLLEIPCFARHQWPAFLRGHRARSTLAPRKFSPQPVQNSSAVVVTQNSGDQTPGLGTRVMETPFPEREND